MSEPLSLLENSADIKCSTVSNMQVVHFRRRPFPGVYSIEGLFDTIAKHLSGQDVQVESLIAPHFSKGLIPRIKNVLWARRHQRRINHITGDIHYIALGLTKRRAMLTIHDLTMLGRLTGWKRSVLKFFWFDLPVRNVAAITVISNATRQKLLELTKVDPKIVYVIPNAVSERFQPSSGTFFQKCPRVLLLGTMHNKNLERTIKALAGLNCQLDIIGRLTDQQRDLLTEYSMTFINRFDLSDEDIVSAYQTCDLVCFASTAEGFGMPIIEAQFVERPVVTSNCSSMPEVAGDGAVLVDPYDVNSIREGVKRVIESSELRERLIAAGRVNRERFAGHNIAAMYRQLYQQIGQ